MEKIKLIGIFILLLNVSCGPPNENTGTESVVETTDPNIDNPIAPADEQRYNLNNSDELIYGRVDSVRMDSVKRDSL